jgi:hypothetical protein
MSSVPAAEPGNLLPLRPVPSPDAELAARAANQVRHQLSLLQGYADLMEGLSPQQNVKILEVMAEKTAELTLALRPFITAVSGDSPTIADYRVARSRNRQLMAEYRLLLKGLRRQLDRARPTLPPA